MFGRHSRLYLRLRGGVGRPRRLVVGSLLLREREATRDQRDDERDADTDDQPPESADLPLFLVAFGLGIAVGYLIGRWWTFRQMGGK